MHCPACAHDEIAYNSCRNRHCPKCQASAAKRWLEARQTELLPVDYYHVVFTLPAPISAIAYTNKSVIYRLLFEVAAETLQLRWPPAFEQVPSWQTISPVVVGLIAASL